MRWSLKGDRGPKNIHKIPRKYRGKEVETKKQMSNSNISAEVGTRNFFWVRNRNSVERSTSAIAIPQLCKEMLLRNRNSAIPQSQFFLISTTSSPQLESFISTIFGIFLAVESDWGSWKKKIGVTKSRATVPLRQVFGFQRNRQF